MLMMRDAMIRAPHYADERQRHADACYAMMMMPLLLRHAADADNDARRHTPMPISMLAAAEERY